MSNPGQIHSSSKSRAGGRKIDSWTYYHPDKHRVEIDIYLINNNSEMILHASSKHPSLAGFECEASDIGELKRMVEADVAARLDSLSSTNWISSVTIQATSLALCDSGKSGVEISFEDAFVDAAAGSSNQSTCRVLKSDRILETVERSITQEMAGDKIGAIRVTHPKSVIVIPTDEETKRQIHDMRTTLDAFAFSLAQALGPDRTARNIPSPDDLVAMMVDAAGKVTTG